MIDDEELREIKKIAKSEMISVAEWVRKTLKAARKNVPAGDRSQKIDAVRMAVQYDFPAADMDRMLGEIEAGYDTQ